MANLLIQVLCCANLILRNRFASAFGLAYLAEALAAIDHGLFATEPMNSSTFLWPRHQKNFAMPECLDSIANVSHCMHNFLGGKMKRILAPLVFALPLVAFAQTLPQVTVTAQGYYSFGYDTYSYGGGQGGAVPFDEYPILIAGAASFADASSVRCSSSGSSKEVTSQSSVTERWIAAEEVYRRLKLFDTFWTRFGINNSVDRKGYFVVIYADGYKEQWAVISPLFSTVTPGSPMPGTLEPGSTPAGVVTPHPVCG
ncbi:hypothetical protein AVMA1855_12100 [Acidovorax sp. SUPP1855]|uniref:hypothetical protein n=1 Tax=Acidovorax sp. SUPP1855 TaxID=431774 RepID=UPI0023DE5238|nr:hypothetical protein [Acidovorax sp. SUPP1855]GKS84894.1 hypothetical protein AVMA1855_12100 [Acidovorax sp. SUPP1855]